MQLRLVEEQARDTARNRVMTLRDLLSDLMIRAQHVSHPLTGAFVATLDAAQTATSRASELLSVRADLDLLHAAASAAETAVSQLRDLVAAEEGKRDELEKAMVRLGSHTCTTTVY